MDGNDYDERPRFLSHEEAAEMLALLERSAAAAEREEDSVVTRLDEIFDDGPGSDEVHFISGWQDLPPASSVTTVAPPGRRRLGAFVLAAAVITSMGVLAFGAMSWLQRCEPADVQTVAVEDARIDQLRAQEQELIKLRQSHLATIAELEARIAALDEQGSPGADEEISQLTATLAEMKAEAHALGIAAELIGKKKQSASQTGSPGSTHGSTADPAVATTSPGPAKPSADESESLVEDNPYGNVSLASVLEGAVREEAFQTGTEKHASDANGKIESLIEEAVKGPSEDAPKKHGEALNALPDEGVVLPPAPSREAVQGVLGSLKPAIRRCGGEPYQRLVVEVTVAGATGRVVGARTIDKAYAGTPVGVCAAKAVKLARFPKFQKDTVVIKYPFDL